MPEMIAISDIEYPPGKAHKPGDRFEVEDAHAQLLEKIGRAKLAESEQTEAVESPRKRGRPRKVL